MESFVRFAYKTLFIETLVLDKKGYNPTIYEGSSRDIVNKALTHCDVTATTLENAFTNDNATTVKINQRINIKKYLKNNTFHYIGYDKIGGVGHAICCIVKDNKYYIIQSSYRDFRMKVLKVSKKVAVMMINAMWINPLNQYEIEIISQPLMSNEEVLENIKNRLIDFEYECTNMKMYEILRRMYIN